MGSTLDGVRGIPHAIAIFDGECICRAHFASFGETIFESARVDALFCERLSSPEYF